MKSRQIRGTKHLLVKPCPCGSGDVSHDCCWRGAERWERLPAGRILARDGSFKHPKCYLAGYGECGPKVTKEHFISRGLLEKIFEKTVKFEQAGQFFGGKQNVEIGIDGFSAKVLCDRHNSSLSILDDAAIRSFDSIAAVSNAMILPNDVEQNGSFGLCSALDMERWLIKVLYGLVAAGKLTGLSGRKITLSELSPLLLPSLMGTVTLPPPLGLYSFFYPGQTLRAHTFGFASCQLEDESDELGGLFMHFGMLSFVLVISQKYGSTFSDDYWHRHPDSLINSKTSLGKPIRFILSY